MCVVLSDVFFLGDFIIFETLKTYEQEQSGRSGLAEEEEEEEEEEEGVAPASPTRYSVAPPSPTLSLSLSSEASALCLSLTGQVMQKIPLNPSTSSSSSSSSSSSRGLSHASVTLLPQAIKASSSGTGMGSAMLKSAHYLAANLSVELHYSKPLSEVITAGCAAKYNEILRCLLPMATAKWAADGAWMMCMRSDLFARGREKGKEREERRKSTLGGSMTGEGDGDWDRDGRRKEEVVLGKEEKERRSRERVRESMSLKSKDEEDGRKIAESDHTRAKCRAGMGLMIHTLSVLQSHYMGIIHGHIVPLYCDSSYTSPPTAPPSTAPHCSANTSSSSAVGVSRQVRSGSFPHDSLKGQKNTTALKRFYMGAATCCTHFI